MKNQSAAMFGCGLEPGLTEIIAHAAIREFAIVDELHIRCGGITLNPPPPLFYQRVFSGDTLPILPKPAYYIKNGCMLTIPRFSDIELNYFQPLGLLEAWHDGMLPWLVDLQPLSKAKLCTQKTLRWPGFATQINFLDAYGLLTEEPILVDNILISPKRVLEILLKNQTTFSKTSRDHVILQITATGIKQSRSEVTRTQLFVTYDEKHRLTAMAQVTGFTLGIAITSIGQSMKHSVGIIRPENVFTGLHYQHLINELIRLGISIEHVQNSSSF